MLFEKANNTVFVHVVLLHFNSIAFKLRSYICKNLHTQIFIADVLAHPKEQGRYIRYLNAPQKLFCAWLLDSVQQMLIVSTTVFFFKCMLRLKYKSKVAGQCAKSKVAGKQRARVG